MSALLYERTDSPVISGKTAERAYLLRTDNDNEELAYQAAYLGIPSSYFQLLRKDPKIKRIAFGLWDATAEFELPGEEANPDNPPDQPQPDQAIGSEWAFNTGGGTEHITQSLATQSYPAGDPLVPETEQAIGVSKEGVAGCDIIVPKFEFSRTMRLPAGAVTMGYVKGLAYATGKTNLMPYLTFGACELLFLGASGSIKSPTEGWSITYSFAVSETKNFVAISPTLQVGVKLGWDYLWVGYEEKQTANGKFTLQKPIFAKVERVYESADFQASLGW